MTLASFFAASTSAGVIATGAGASARTGEANMLPAASAAEAFAAPCRMSRLESFRPFIASSRLFFFSPAQGAATVRWQCQPDLAAFADIGFGRRGEAQRRAVGDFDHVVARGAEIDLTGHDGLDRIVGRSRRLRRKPDVVLADRHRRTLARRERRT